MDEAILEAKIEAAVVRVIIASVATVSDFEKAALAYAPAYHEAMDKMQYGGNAQATREANEASKAWQEADAKLIECARAVALAYYAEQHPTEAA